MRRFLIEASQVEAGRAVLNGAQFHHAARVLRLRVNDVVALFDRQGNQYMGRVESVERDHMHVQIIRQSTIRREPEFRLTVIQSIAKAAAMDFIIQKCSELGAVRLIAVPTERSAVRIPREKVAARRQRWQRIADNSAEQCGRSRPMEVEIAAGLDQALGMGEGPVIALYEGEKASGLADAIEEHRGSKSASVVVGPEGGLCPAEVQRLKEAGATLASLGPRILRAETAAVAAAAILMYELGDLGNP